MPTELLQTRIFGNAIGNANSAITAKANSGFSNMVVLTNGGISATRVWEFPLALRVPDAKFKVTILGAGGQGGGCNVAGRVATGAGGGAGGLLMVWFHVLQGCYQLQYIVGVGGTTGTLTTAGQNGSNTSLWYWNGSYGSTADYIGNGGTGGGLSTNVSTSIVGGAGGGTNVPSGTVFRYQARYLAIPGGNGGGGGVQATNYSNDACGAHAPLGLGQGGPNTTASAAGSAATGYGAGGGGATNGAGGAGGDGLIIIEY